MTKTQLRDLINKRATDYGLVGWVFEIVVGPLRDSEDKTVYATCSASPEYRHAELSFDLKKITKAGQNIDLVVRNELAHCRNADLESLLDWFLEDGQRARAELVRRASEAAATVLERK